MFVCVAVFSFHFLWLTAKYSLPFSCSFFLWVLCSLVVWRVCVFHLDVKCVPCNDAIVLALWSDSENEVVPDIITRRDNPFLNSNPRQEEDEDEEEEGRFKAMPNKQKDDLAQRRAQSRPLPHRDGPMSFVSASMSQADLQKWERLKMTEPRCPTHTLCFSTHAVLSTKMLLYVKCGLLMTLRYVCVFL